MTLTVALTGRRGRGFAFDIALEAPAASVTALLGPSGSGKTSVLRAIAGLDRHAGTVRFGDAVWQDATVFVPPHRRRIGYVAQGPSLLPHLTVAANLDYVARRTGTRRGGHEAIVALTAIGELLDRRPATLSGGEARRAAIARALIGAPQLLLMDEPLSGLDTDARSAMLVELEAMFRRLAMPVIYVTHDRAEADRLAAHAIRLDDGRIVGVTEGPLIPQ